MTTMRDIADRAGVSRSTVSFVLNEKHSLMGVNEETRRRVLRLADEMGYRRNGLARAVVTGKSPILGFLVWAPMLESEVAARVLNGVLDEAEAYHHTVQVLRLSGANDNDEEIIRRCVELRPAGVMGLNVDPALLRHLQQEMARFHIPVAVLDSSPPLPGGSRILSDDVEGCRQAVAHLADLGHQRIAFIGGKPDTVVSRARDRGYHEAMAGLGLEIPPGYVEVGYWDVETVEHCTIRLFRDLPQPPTAVFCADDKTAAVACRTLRALGRRIPDDVSVVGFADLSIAAYNDPPLTTVAQPFHEMARRAVRRLLFAAPAPGEALPDSCHEELLPTRLIVRRSTAPLPAPAAPAVPGRLQAS